MNAPDPLVVASPAPSAHYENFPVASWLCPPRLRPPVAAIYWFARTADDIADEGNEPADVRLQELAAYRRDLAAVFAGRPHSGGWAEVFDPLAHAIATHELPEKPLADLLSAFTLDVEKTRDGTGYADRAELLDYCRRSANPVGRLLLHLYGVSDGASLAQSDAICSALQLINFWQDLSVDLPRGRSYLPAADCAARGVHLHDVAALRNSPLVRRLLKDEVRWARELMMQGAPLVHAIGGRGGWELRAVVQSGLRVLDRIEAAGFDSLTRRHTLRRTDAAPILWRMLWM